MSKKIKQRLSVNNIPADTEEITVGESAFGSDLIKFDSLQEFKKLKALFIQISGFGLPDLTQIWMVFNNLRILNIWLSALII